LNDEKRCCTVRYDGDSIFFEARKSLSCPTTTTVLLGVQ
jgi:hypothetical protein